MKLLLVLGIVAAASVFLVAQALAADTGFHDPSAQTAAPGGDNNGFEVDPNKAFTNNAGYARNMDGAGGRHIYYNYAISIPASAYIHGIEVRLDWWLDNKDGTNSMQVELSWDGGITWTGARSDSTETTSEHSKVLGGPNDTWGRDWTAADLSNANFRVRLTSSSNRATRDFYLDWVAVKVYYSSVEANPPLAASCGLDLAMVIDGSLSIDASEYAQMQTAFQEFVEAFAGTPTEYALVEFATSAAVRQGFTADGTSVINEINEPRIQPGGVYTNWDDGLFKARGLFPHRANPDLIVFASDGNPNRRDGHGGHPGSDGVDVANESAAMEWAILEANAAKLAGTRIITVGIGTGSGEIEALDVQNLTAIAGPNVADGPGEVSIGTDVILTDFATLADDLAKLAGGLCGGSVDLYISDVTGDEDSEGDELVFNVIAENMLPGETQAWTVRLENAGTRPWDLSAVDTTGSSGWSCDADPAPEFSVSFDYFDSFVDNHGTIVHVDPGEYEEARAKVSLDLGAGNECQGDAFSLVADFQVTQHLP